MTINDILAARDSLVKLNYVKFNDFSVTRKVYKLNKQFNSVIELALNEQNKIIDIYTKKDAQGKPIMVNAQYEFEKVEDRTKCFAEIAKLRSSNITDIEKVQIPLSSIELAKDISTQDLLLLECIIDWV